MVTVECSMCATVFSGHANAKYCSARCRNRYRESRRGPSCVSCGKKMWASHSQSAEPMCHPCRRKRPGYVVRNVVPIQSWTCRGCGRECSRSTVRGTRPKWCDSCRRLISNRDIKVSMSVRVGIYERDHWMCWLCRDDVDRTLIGSMSPWRPSLDHVVPRAQGGSDDPDNLNLAHWWCNSARSDGRSYSPEDFRVSA